MLKNILLVHTIQIFPGHLLISVPDLLRVATISVFTLFMGGELVFI